MCLCLKLSFISVFSSSVLLQVMFFNYFFYFSDLLDLGHDWNRILAACLGDYDFEPCCDNMEVAVASWWVIASLLA